MMNSTLEWENTTPTACPEEHVVPSSGDLFAFIIDTIVVGCLCLVGMVGNTISVIAFSREKQNTTSVLLTALAVADFLYLVVHGLLFQCFRSIYPYTGKFKAYHDFVPYIDVWEYPFGVIFQTFSVFFVILVAFDRYIAVCWPLKAKYWCTVKRVKIQIVSALLFGVAINFPRFFTSKTITEYDVCSQSMKTKIVRDNLGVNQVYGYVMTCVYIILIYLLPIVILIVINIRLAHAVRRSIETSRRLSNRSQADAAHACEPPGARITAMLCLVILVFLLCQIPISINHLQYATGGTMSVVPQRYYNIICNMLVTLNSAVNFFIYVLMGSKFRERVKRLFSRRARERSPRKGSSGFQYSTNSLHTNSTQVSRLSIDES